MRRSTLNATCFYTSRPPPAAIVRLDLASRHDLRALRRGNAFSTNSLIDCVHFETGQPVGSRRSCVHRFLPILIMRFICRLLSQLARDRLPAPGALRRGPTVLCQEEGFSRLPSQRRPRRAQHIYLVTLIGERELRRANGLWKQCCIGSSH